PQDLPADTYAIAPGRAYAVTKQPIGTVHGFTGFDVFDRDGGELGTVETGVEETDTAFVTNTSLHNDTRDQDFDWIHLAAHYITSYTDRKEFRAPRVAGKQVRFVWEHLYELTPFDRVGTVTSYRGPTGGLTRFARFALGLRDGWALYNDESEILSLPTGSVRPSPQPPKPLPAKPGLRGGSPGFG